MSSGLEIRSSNEIKKTKGKTMREPVHVVCVTDEDSGHEALYIGGELRFSDNTVYACDIARETDGMVIELTHMSIGLPSDQEYPKQLGECLKWVRDEGPEDPTDFGAELQRQIDASPELAEAVFEASVEIDRESARYKELKKRVLEWLREKRDEDGSGCCYGLKTIADAMKCTMGELVDWDNDYGVLFDLGREGNISWTAGQECVYAVGGRTTWDEF